MLIIINKILILIEGENISSDFVKANKANNSFLISKQEIIKLHVQILYENILKQLDFLYFENNKRIQEVKVNVSRNIIKFSF